MKDRIYHTLLRLFIWLHSESERYFFYYLPKIFGKHHPKNNFDFRTRDFLKRVSSGDIVADLGCGTGKLAKSIAALGRTVYGIDRSPPTQSQIPHLTFIQKDLLSDDLGAVLRSLNVNLVILSHVLEHLPDPVGFLNNLGTVPRLLICVPSEENWRYQLKKSLNLDPRTDPDHKREYTIASLSEELSRTPWSINEIFYNAQGEIFADCRKIQG